MTWNWTCGNCGAAVTQKFKPFGSGCIGGSHSWGCVGSVGPVEVDLEQTGISGFTACVLVLFGAFVLLFVSAAVLAMFMPERYAAWIAIGLAAAFAWFCFYSIYRSRKDDADAVAAWELGQLPPAQPGQLGPDDIDVEIVFKK